MDIRLGVLTISDRASRGEYADLSGPQIQAQLKVLGTRDAGGARGTRDAGVQGVQPVRRVIDGDVPDARAARGTQWMLLSPPRSALSQIHLVHLSQYLPGAAGGQRVGREVAGYFFLIGSAALLGFFHTGRY